MNLILVTYDRVDEVREVVACLERNARSDHVLTVVDNHSGPDMQRFLRALRKRHPGMRVVRNLRNRYCGGATNQALALSRERYAIYLCAHECFPLEEGFDLRCVEYMDAHPDVAQAGHLISSPAYADGRGYQRLEAFKEFRNPGYAAKRVDDLFFHVQGGFWVLRRDAVRKVGAFNPRIPHAHMDVEYSYYLESEGWRIADLPFVLSLHRTTRPALEGYDPGHAVYHPLTPHAVRDYLAQRERQSQAGRRCPVCDWTGARFEDLPSATPGRDGEDARCPSCGSLPRDRVLVDLLDADGSLAGVRMLDLAPTDRLESFFRARSASYQRSGTAIDATGSPGPLPDARYDLVVCCDLLQRVRDDRALAGEMRRVLGAGGRALVQIPQSRHRWRTLELAEPTPQGHLREPGLDYGERFRALGWNVELCDPASLGSLDQRVLHGVYRPAGAFYRLEAAR